MMLPASCCCMVLAATIFCGAVSAGPVPCFLAAASPVPIRRPPGVRSSVCKILLDEKAASIPLVIPQSKLWVEKFIIGLNLCPFAREPFKKNTIRYAISDAKDGDELIEDCFVECARLLDSEPERVSTTLVLAPAFSAGLQAWGDIGYWMEDYLDEEDEPLFDNKVGVAFFHPNWNFEELEQDDATHFERRAPYPTVSLLRKDDIGVIVQDFLHKDIIISEKVHKDNAKTLADHGFHALSMLMKKIRTAGKQVGKEAGEKDRTSS